MNEDFETRESDTSTFSRDQKVTWKELTTIVLGIAFFAMLVSYPEYPYEKRSSCIDNLKRYGVAIRMYAEESPREYYPPMNGWIKPLREGRAGVSRPRSFNFNPRASLLFPDYLTDLSIMICPTDQYNGLTNASECSATIVGESTDSHKTAQIGEHCDPFFDDSYHYYGWVFDKISGEGWAGQNDALKLETSLEKVGIDIDFLSENDPRINSYFFYTQRIASLTNLQNRASKIMTNTSNSNTDIRDQYFNIWNDDIMLQADDLEDGIWDEKTDYGNGNYHGVFRLRVGIERFTTTDINGGMPQRTKNLPILFENSNRHGNGKYAILFLDGHAEFINLGSTHFVDEKLREYMLEASSQN